jgi:hypothetical protein
MGEPRYYTERGRRFDSVVTALSRVGILDQGELHQPTGNWALPKVSYLMGFPRWLFNVTRPGSA